MRVVFAGPSIYGVDADLSGVHLRPPAAHGDVLRATVDGASVIGIIDGAFEETASVWHKGILYALNQGVAVLGGASMGALRAAECAAFGMVPVGTIAQRFIDGLTDDDADVAIIHGPVELGSPPLTMALVDCLATLERMQSAGALTAAEVEHAQRVARAMFYKDRTIAALARRAFPRCAAVFEAMCVDHRVSIKAQDALEVIRRVQALPALRSAPPAGLRLNEPPLWRETLTRILGDRDRDNSLAEQRSKGKTLAATNNTRSMG